MYLCRVHQFNQSGHREFSNDPIAHLTVEHPTDVLHVDIAIGIVVAIVRKVWDAYIMLVARTKLPLPAKKKTL